MNSYDIGDKVKLETTFSLEINGVDVLKDPNEVILKIKRPSKVVDIYLFSLDEIINGGTGYYYKEIFPDESGTWHYRFEGIGIVDTAEDESFRIRKSQIVS